MAKRNLLNTVGAACVLLISLGVGHGFGQATIATGSVQGTVTDSTGAVVPSAQIKVANAQTGQTTILTSSATGTYNSGALLPGDYLVTVTAPGFSTVSWPVTVQVGVVSSGKIILRPGVQKTEIQVSENPVSVNTEQATVGTVMTTQQIQQLPIGGRNFIDLAQLAPGVQIQDAGNFMPTKEGFASVSFQGRFGQTARIEVDGVDISDETFGTTTQNIPAVGIQEFQVSQSSLDLSTELTSSGAVNVVTRSGTNKYHGEVFALARSHLTSARIAPKDEFWRRQQYGASFGGPLIKNKLFFFAGWERPKQDLFFPVVLAPPFSALSGGYNVPFRENQTIGRLDWEIKPNWRAFYRFSWDQMNLVTAVPNTYEPFQNRTHTPVQAAGTDFNTGSFTHSIRFGYTRFWDEVTDVTKGMNIVNPAPDVSLVIGFGACVPGSGDVFCSGPSFVAPQYAAQHNSQFKYDCTKVYRSHILRYGVAYNRIRSLVVASLTGTAPIAFTLFAPFTQALAATGPFPGGDTNPANYPVNFVLMGNRAGFFTETPRFGFPGGGVDDDRFDWYVGDSWKAKPNFTLTYGVRYVRDTGRTDSDLPPVPLLDQWQTGLGDRVHQPNKNFAPQAGFAWDPWKNGKTSIRAGAGLFYENTLHSNVVFDRAGRLEKGVFQDTLTFCPNDLRLPNGSILTGSSSLCFQPVGLVASQLLALQDLVAAQTRSLGPQSNPSYIGNTLTNAGNLFSPNYRTPFSWQINAGVQRQLRKGTLLTADYLRNVGLHFLLASDVNHVGDARFLNKSAAAAAIGRTLDACGVSSISAGIKSPCPGGVPSPVTGSNIVGRPLDITDFAANGLDSGSALFGGAPSAKFGIPPDFGAAFPGANPNVGLLTMLFPQARSAYNGLQVTLLQDLDRPLPGVRHVNLQASYALSRFVSEAVNQDFSPVATDFRDPGHFIGPNGLDRTHQVSLGGIIDLPLTTRLTFIGHVQTARSLSLTLPGRFGGSAGEIFRTDVTGDGTIGDLVPGSQVGSFGRNIKVDDLNGFITKYNSTDAGKITPAGQALIDAGLFTSQELQALGAVTPTLSAAPAGEVGLDSLLTFDLRLGWSIKLPKKMESLAIEPTVAVYNLFNFANYDGVGGTLSGVLNGLPGSVNGTTPDVRLNRTTFGSGTFAYGAPRMFEWGLRVVF